MLIVLINHIAVSFVYLKNEELARQLVVRKVNKAGGWRILFLHLSS